MERLTDELGLVFARRGIWHRLEEIPAENRRLFRWNQTMRDAGLAEDSVMLDFTVDAGHGVFYLGLIRIPPQYRGKGAATELIGLMKGYALMRHFVIILESSPENYDFWHAEHFSSFLYEKSGFWMMGYGGESKQVYRVKWAQFKSARFSGEPAIM